MRAEKGSAAAWHRLAPRQNCRCREGADAPSKTVLAGEVVRVNAVARFVVLSFPLDQMPAMDQRLNLYRHGAKVAEVKVTGPQRDRNVVADILTGAPDVGDEVRPD